jgi:hypothetical protein
VTALAQRRKRLNRTMAAGTVVCVAAVVVLVAVGIAGLRNYTAAKPSATIPPPAAIGLPKTQTALLGTLDDHGVLATLTVFVLRSNSPGGSIVTVPVNANANQSGDAGAKSFQQLYTESGDAAVVEAVQGVLSLTFDFWLVAPPERASALFLPVAPLPVTFAENIMATVDGTPQPVFKAGKHELEAAEIVQALSSRVANAPEALRRQTIATMWSAIAAKVGTGIGTAPATVDSIDALVTSLYAGPVGARALPSTAISGDRNPSGADVDDIDTAESILVFATVAPSAMVAPRSGSTYRLLAPPGSEARLKDAINIIMFSQGNILSVSLSGPQQATTQMYTERTDAAEMQDVSTALGGVEVRKTESPIEGIDVTVIFGTDFLSQPSPPASAVPTTLATSAGTAVGALSVDGSTPGGGG